jgi:hypothetical protein
MNFLAPEQGLNLMQQAGSTPVLTVFHHIFPRCVRAKKVI